MTFTADGPDVSGLAQPGFDWSAAAGCTTRGFASARISHGPYTGSDGQVHPGFIDSNGAPNRAGMIAAGFGRRIWYTIITPLASAEAQADQVRRWVDLNGGLPPGEAIAIDWEDNPNNPGEAASLEQVLTMWQALADLYGSGRVGFYGSRGYLDQLPDARGFRWLASYTSDARVAAIERACVAVQWTSSFLCDGWGGRLDMNEVVDAHALDAACAVLVADFPPLDLPEVVVGAPQGALDLVQPVYVNGRWTGEVRYSGWAYDPDTPERAIDVQIILNGVLCGVLPANRSRTDVNAALGIPGDHGYDGIVTVKNASVIAEVLGVDSSGSGAVSVATKATMIPLADAAAPPVDPIPPVDPPVDPPVGTVDDAHIEAIARDVARDEISRAHLTPGA